MKLQNEKKETVYKYDLDCTDEEFAQLKKIALERFPKDEQAQIEYAVISILKEMIDFDESHEALAKKTTKKKKKVTSTKKAK